MLAKWEIAPHSEYKNYKLVATNKIDNNIYLIIMRNGKSDLMIELDDIKYQDDELIDYVSDLLPKILSGVYDVELLNKELD